MKKVSLIVYHEFLENVIKNLHKAGIMQIIDIAKDSPSTLEEAEKAEMHPEAGICTNYDLRLSRLIDILKKTRKSSSGIKAMLRPKTPAVKKVKDKALDELYSFAEGTLNEIEKNILNFEESLRKLDEHKEKLDFDLEQINYIKDFTLDIE